MNDLVRVESQGQIVEVVLNRAEKRNAVNWPMMHQLSAAFDAIERMSEARVVILRAEGPIFCAGLDLMGFVEMVEHFGENWMNNLFHATSEMQHVVRKIEQCTLPVIAVLHGHCIGLGTEIALACDLRVAAENTVISLPETRIGLIPDVGGTTRLTRLIGAGRAKEYIMTGRAFALADAERWGLVNHVVPQESLSEKVHALADELIAAAPLAVSYAKKVIDGLGDLDRGLHLEAWAQSILMRSEDFSRGAQAVMLKQKPEWHGK